MASSRKKAASLPRTGARAKSTLKNPVRSKSAPQPARIRLTQHVTSGGWGFRVGASLGMGWVKRAGGVTREWLAAGGFEVEVAGVRHPATLQPGAFYDPRGERMRA